MIIQLMSVIMEQRMGNERSLMEFCGVIREEVDDRGNIGKIQQKRQLKLVKESLATATAEYKRECNGVKAAVRQDKNEWLDKQCRDIEKHHAEHRTREIYKLARVLKRKWQPRTSAIKDKKGKTLTDKFDIMERWTEYCSKLYKNEDDNDTVEELKKEREWISPLQKDDTSDYMLKEGVEKAITRTKNNESWNR